LQADRPAHYVAKSLQAAGVKIIPIPVYYPDVQEILGEKVFRKLHDVPHPVDIVDVFRRAEDLAGHLDDILEVKPKVI
jgi:predicted CoA-binding protein